MEARELSCSSGVVAFDQVHAAAFGGGVALRRWGTQVIVLNGTSSAGKTSIGRCLQSAQVQAKTVDCTPGPNTDLAGCDYANSDLSNVDFAGSDLTGANLSETNLNGTTFSGSTLKRADLLGAGIVEDCTMSTCASTDLSGTFPDQNIEFDTAPNFTNADLKDANLSTARLGGGTVAT